MLIVKVDHGLDKALKTLKNKVRNTKLIQELRDRQAFNKPSVTKRALKLKAIYVQANFPDDEK